MILKSRQKSLIIFLTEILNNLFTNNKDLPKELQNDFANELDNIINGKNA